jgi:hypothetical protein
MLSSGSCCSALAALREPRLSGGWLLPLLPADGSSTPRRVFRRQGDGELRRLPEVASPRGSPTVYVAPVMSGGGVYLRQGETLIAMREEPYATEAVLQTLLADHPDLLAGDQTDPEEPRRWLLVSQELSLATEADGSGRWNVGDCFVRRSRFGGDRIGDLPSAARPTSSLTACTIASVSLARRGSDPVRRRPPWT